MALVYASSTSGTRFPESDQWSFRGQWWRTKECSSLRLKCSKAASWLSTGAKPQAYSTPHLCNASNANTSMKSELHKVLLFSGPDRARMRANWVWTCIYQLSSAIIQHMINSLSFEHVSRWMIAHESFRSNESNSAHSHALPSFDRVFFFLTLSSMSMSIKNAIFWDYIYTSRWGTCPKSRADLFREVNRAVFLNRTSGHYSMTHHSRHCVT